MAKPRSQSTKSAAEAFMRAVYKTPRKAKSLFTDLKYDGSDTDIKDVAKILPQTYHLLMFGRSRPNSYPELFKRTQTFTGNLDRELTWTIAALKKHSNELMQFFESRDSFDKKIFLGQYLDAKAVLESIELSHGVSLWGLSSRFLLENLAGGLDANTRYLSEFNSIEGHHTFTTILASFLSMRAERELSHENFQRKIERYLKHFDTNDWFQAFFTEILGSSTKQDFAKHYASTLFILADTSIIDRALSLLRYFKHKAIETPGKAPELLRTVLELQTCLPSHEVQNLCLSAGKVTIAQPTEFDVKMMAALDEYTKGEYEISGALAAELLLTNPHIFQLYEIFAKSTIFVDAPFISPFAADSPATKILWALDQVYRKTALYNEALGILSRSAEMFHDTPMSAGCRYIVEYETVPGKGSQWEYQMLFASRFINPLLPKLTKTLNDKQAALREMQNALPNSLTLQFLHRVGELQTSNEPITYPADVSERRKLFYTAVLHMERNRFDSAIPLLEKLYHGRLDERRNDYPLYDSIISALYTAYLRAKETLLALQLYVANYLKEPLVLKGLDTETLRIQLESNDNLTANRELGIPIFYSSINSSSQNQYVAYDNYLTAHGYNVPGDLIRDSSITISKELIYFLHRICVQKVMAGSFHFTGSEDLESQRLLICQHLCRIDAQNEHVYSKEIDAITQHAFIRHGIQTVEEGKIYVDLSGIRRAGDKLLRESYKRYRDLSVTLGSGELRLMDTTSVEGITSLPASSSGMQRTIEDLRTDIRVAFTSSQFALFKEQFFDIRDRFISSSEYGLDSYLSVRIRHGTLEGQIRSRFEALHLVTQRDAHSGVYQKNDYWTQTLPECNGAQQETVQSLLAELSRDVDDIARNLKDSIVQIRTESKNPTGLFDFRFEQGGLLALFFSRFKGISSYEEFIDNAILILWTRLNASLEVLRFYMMHDLKEAFVQRLTTLQATLRQSLGSGKAIILQGNITSCLTAIQNECDRIGRWFTLTGARFENDVTLRQIIDVCVASVNNVNPEVRFAPTIQVSSDRKLSSRYFLPIFDILRTLLDNAIRYSPKPSNVFIGGAIGDRNMCISMQNNLSEEVRKSDPVSRLHSQVERIRSRGVTEDIKREGGTGYAKIVKILQFDLGRRDLRIEFEYPFTKRFKVEIGFEAEGLLP